MADCYPVRGPMSELGLLDEIAQGRDTYTREEYFNLDDFDVMLRGFADQKYVEKIVRDVRSRNGCAHVEAITILGGLTILGERRRLQLWIEEARRLSGKA